MTTTTRPPHPLANKTVKVHLKSPPIQILEDGCLFVIEDWWQNVNGGKSWMDSNNNPACMMYAVRSGVGSIPTDDQVIYGHVQEPMGGGLGYLVHATELGEVVDPYTPGGEHCPECGVRHEGECAETISYDDAVAALQDGDHVNTIQQIPPVMVGDCWPREEVIRALRRAPRIFVPGANAQASKFGLAILDHEGLGLLFFATKGRTSTKPPEPSHPIEPDSIEKGA